MIFEFIATAAIATSPFDWNPEGFICSTERAAGMREDAGRWTGDYVEGSGIAYIIRPIDGDGRLRWGLTVIGDTGPSRICGFEAPNESQRNLVCGSGRETFDFDLPELAFVRVDYRTALSDDGPLIERLGRSAVIQYGSCTPL